VSSGDRSRPLVGLDEAVACGPELTGGKAATLALLRQAGFPVPGGFVVTVPALSGVATVESGVGVAEDLRPTLPQHVRESLRSFVADEPSMAWAVRSSAVMEDSATASFAGQYETYLDVRGMAALETAIIDCWMSALHPRAATYRDDVGVTDRRIAVLVQRYLDAEVAGVALGADPLTGHRGTVVVSAIRGSGADLVGGVAVPEEWEVVADRAHCRRTAGGILTAETARSIAAVLRKLEARQQSPQDMEWAMVSGEIFVLQLRPMTGLPAEVTWPAPRRGGWLRTIRLGEWLPEPVTPLCHTWLLDRMEERFRALQRTVGGFLAPAPLHVLVNGWYFHSPIGTGSQALLVTGLLRRPRLALATLVGRRRPEWSYRLAHRRLARQWHNDILPRYRSLIARVGQRVEVAEPPELLDIVDQVADLAGECFWSLVLSGGAAWRAEEALTRFHRRRVSPRVSTPSQVLLQGLSAHQLLPHAVYSLDWTRPTLGEFSSSPASDGARTIRHDRAGTERLAAEAACRQAVATRRRVRRRFDCLLDVAQRAAVLRQEHTDWFTAGWPTMRRAVVRLGETLSAAALIDDPDDVFLLTKAEVVAGIRGTATADVRTLVRARRQTWERQRRLVPPPAIGRMPFLLARMLAPAVRRPRAANPDGALRGIPTSPGQATGQVRVLRGQTAVDDVRTGEILVVSAAVPALTETFGRIRALCVDNGSVAAHAAIVAREYGLPTVMGLVDATTRLVDGQIVTVDGTAGVVELW
jgi:phosphohistidine swiveling domain-containing protein